MHLFRLLQEGSFYEGPAAISCLQADTDQFFVVFSLFAISYLLHEQIAPSKTGKLRSLCTAVAFWGKTQWEDTKAQWITTDIPAFWKKVQLCLRAAKTMALPPKTKTKNLTEGTPWLLRALQQTQRKPQPQPASDSNSTTPTEHHTQNAFWSLLSNVSTCMFCKACVTQHAAINRLFAHRLHLHTLVKCFVPHNFTYYGEFWNTGVYQH